MNKRDILKKLMEIRSRDKFFEGGRVLSSVSTKPLEISLEAYRIFSDVNALDRYIFPNVDILEREVIEWFGKVLKNEDISGYITTGGTEANISALWVAKKMYPERRKILVPKSAHYSIIKAADMMGLDIIWIPLDNKFKADVRKIKEKISEEILAVVVTAGTSALGVIDPIERINRLCDNVFLHVDAAFAGFILPFMEGVERIDFELENIDSITIDPHKMGFAPIPSGCILFRDKSYMRNIEITPAYLPFTTSTLVGSRSGGHIAATWATVKYFDIEGYRKEVKKCINNTRLLCKLLGGIKGIEILVKPEINFVALRGERIVEIHKELIKRGWSIILDRDTMTMRVVVMPHVTRDVIRNFISDLREITQEY